MWVVGIHWELFFLASVDSIGEEQQRSADLILDQKSRVAEVIDHALLALNSCVGYAAHLEAVESLPSTTIELVEKWNNVDGKHEVDESVSYVALVFEVDGQVEKVKLAAIRLESFEKHSLAILVGDVLDHEGRSGVNACHDVVDLQLEVRSSVALDKVATWRLGVMMSRSVA